MIDKLEMLIALARERHFGRAAEACHVTQPTLSSNIKALEEQLGAQLVNRGSRFIGLTPEGERVLARAYGIVAEARALKSDVASPSRALSGVLRLGVIPTALVEARSYTAPFLARHPNVSLKIHSMTSKQIVTGLAEFSIDAGISYAETDLLRDPLAGIEAMPLYEERYALLCTDRPDLPEAMEWTELAGKYLGLLTPDMQNRRIINAAMAAAGVAATPRMESNSILALVSMVSEVGLSTILPERIARYFSGLPGLTSVPLTSAGSGGFSSSVALIVPPQGRRSALLDAFIRQSVVDRQAK